MKLVLLFICLCCTILASHGSPRPQGKVAIPADCAQACPPGGKKLCARNKVTGKLGTFESDCVFGRYNSCVKTTQTYEFVKYGDC